MPEHSNLFPWTGVTLLLLLLQCQDFTAITRARVEQNNGNTGAANVLILYFSLRSCLVLVWLLLSLYFVSAPKLVSLVDALSTGS